MNKIALNGQTFELCGPAGPDGNPIGTVISFMGLKAPKDYLVCDGSAYNISDYPDLAAFFKDQFGSETYFGGSGDTFAVPDMRNLFLRGYHGNASEMLSGDIGKKQEATVHQHVSQNGTGKLATYDGNGASNADTDLQRYGIAYVTVSSTNNALNSNLYTSRPVNMAVLYCIKAVKS